MKASIGRIVVVLGIASNGTDEQPAIITRAWDSAKDTKDGMVCVNVRVFPDCGTPENHGSVQLYETRAEAVAARAGAGLVAFWPERV